KARRHTGKQVVVKLLLKFILVACRQAGDVALEENRAGAHAIEYLTRFPGLNGDDRVLRAHIAVDYGEHGGDSYRQSDSAVFPRRYLRGPLALYSRCNGLTIRHVTMHAASAAH